MMAETLNHSTSIRSATEEDFDRVMEIDRLSFSAPWSYNFFQSALENIFLVLEKEEEIVGYLITCVCHDLEKAVILRIAVHPDHRGQGLHGALEVCVHDCVVVLAKPAELLASPLQAAPDGGLVVLSSGSQPSAQHLERGRQDEHRDGVGELLAKLSRSLPHLGWTERRMQALTDRLYRLLRELPSRAAWEHDVDGQNAVFEALSWLSSRYRPDV